MSLTAYTPAAVSGRSATGIAPVAWVVIGVATMGAVRAVEGVVEIGREILGADPKSSDGSSEATGQPPVRRVAPHEMAGFLLIVASAYAVRLARRAMADVADVAREIGTARA